MHRKFMFASFQAVGKVRRRREYNLKAARITMHTTRYLQHGPNSDVSTLPQIALLAHDL